jgi:hypothetical protein
MLIHRTERLPFFEAESIVILPNRRARGQFQCLITHLETMKNGLLLTSVLVTFCFAATLSTAQDKSRVINAGTNASVAAKCTGSADCKACKNCSACEHCKKDGGKCSVCSTAAHSSSAAHTNASSDEDVTEVSWSAKSLKPAATTLERLDVRSGPGAAFKVVGKVTSTDPIIIIGEREGWYKIVVSRADLVGFVETASVHIVQ